MNSLFHCYSNPCSVGFYAASTQALIASTATDGATILSPTQAKSPRRHVKLTGVDAGGALARHPMQSSAGTSGVVRHPRMPSRQGSRYSGRTEVNRPTIGVEVVPATCSRPELLPTKHEHRSIRVATWWMFKRPDRSTTPSSSGHEKSLPGSPPRITGVRPADFSPAITEFQKCCGSVRCCAVFPA